MYSLKEIHIPLNPEQMADLYEWLQGQDERGKTSVGKVAEYLKGVGLKSPKTKRAYSRQNVFLALKRSSRYAALVPHKVKKVAH